MVCGGFPTLLSICIVVSKSLASLNKKNKNLKIWLSLE